MNVKPSWDTTPDMFTDDCAVQPPLFSYKNGHKDNALTHIHTLDQFDADVLRQNEVKGGIRTVSAMVNNVDGVELDDWIACPLYDLEPKVLTGYQLFTTKKKTQPIKVGTGLSAIHLDKEHTARCFIATDNFNLFLRLDKLNYTAVYHSKVFTAYEAVNAYLADSKPRIIATNKQLNHDADLKVHFDADVSQLTDMQIKERLQNKATEIKADAVEQTALDQDAENLDQTDIEITRLATLSEIEYEQTRVSAAETLGIRASMLDKLVRAKRKELSELQNENDFFEHIEAWHSPVNGGELLDDIYSIVNNHIACEQQTAIAASLWIVFTWAIDAMQIAPIACITAPEKRCGKTQLLTLIGELCKKPLPTSNVTAAALYRAIEEWQPTLLIDEADTFLKDNEDIRGVINAGHSRKNAFVVRCDGDDNRPKRFNVWGAKAISGIGHLPETIKDRSIILELRRKLPSEHKQRLRHTDPKHWYVIKSKCLRWVNDNIDVIKNARPKLPDCLNDRAYDNWEALFIIAQIAGAEWLAKANFAALAINGTDANTPSINEQLLADIKAIFDKLKTETMFTSGLIEALIEDDLSLWATWNHGGKPITPRQLANRLQSFGVKPKDLRIGLSVKKGYQLKQFNDAFTRYLPKSDVTSATTLQPIQNKAYSDFSNATHAKGVADKKSLNPMQDKGCSVVADRNTPLANTTAKADVADNSQGEMTL